MTTTVPPVSGIILAGGKSTRFGTDKASALLRGRPLLGWVAAALAEVCADIVVVRARGQVLPPFDPQVEYRVADDQLDARGPLAGLVSGLPAAREAVALAVACDAPLVRPALLRMLATHIGGADAVVPRVGGFLQPLVAAYRGETCVPAFEAALEAGDGRILSALSRLQVHELGEDVVRTVDPELVSFRNVNDRAALAAIEEWLRRR